MIIYQNDCKGFREDVGNFKVAESIERNFIKNMGYKPNNNEVMSWNNSFMFVDQIINKAELPDDCGVLIEFNIPNYNKRIDFIITGYDDFNNENFIIMELKQWQTAEATTKDGIVKTVLNRSFVETTHPSYQASSYKLFLSNFNENIYLNNINAYSCAYLHNYNEKSPEPLKDTIYSDYVEDSPLFFRNDYEKLVSFIRKYVGKGNGILTLYKIDQGKIRPSQKLIDYVNELYEGNDAFILLDDQKIVFESALEIVTTNRFSINEKRTIIIEGGPGTGKSVISFNLLGKLLKKSLNTVFVAPNAAFRDVMIKRLAKNQRKQVLKYLITGSGRFTNLERNTFDVIIVDEAHRLKDEKAYGYSGDNQIEDIISSSYVNIFFIDDNQKIRPEDIGSVENIIKISKKHQSSIYRFKLDTQFRCAGANSYIDWLDYIFKIDESKKTLNWENSGFDFRIIDDPNELYDHIKNFNSQGFSARMLAGYAWKWTKDGNANADIEDVIIPEYDFKKPWNSRNSRTTWADDIEGINQVGCIHTSQGLEFDYVGVIIGKDLRYDPQTQTLYCDWNTYKDSVGKKGLKNNHQLLTNLVKNIYKTLMTRGLKGCYTFIYDSALKNYFKDHINRIKVSI